MDSSVAMTPTPAPAGYSDIVNEEQLRSIFEGKPTPAPAGMAERKLMDALKKGISNAAFIRLALEVEAENAQLLQQVSDREQVMADLVETKAENAQLRAQVEAGKRYIECMEKCLRDSSETVALGTGLRLLQLRENYTNAAKEPR